MNQVTVIVCAMSAEARLLRQALPSLRELAVEGERFKAWAGMAGERTIAVIQAGMGPQRAEQAVRLAAESLEVNAIFSIGFAGALDPRLRAGELVIPAEAVRLEGAAEKESYEADHLLFQSAVSAAQEHSQNSIAGKVATADRFVAEVSRKREIFRNTGAVAVDMESAAVAAAAAELRIPVAFVRAISDPADLDLSDWYRVASGNGRDRPASDDAAARLRDATEAFEANSRIAARNLALCVRNLVDRLAHLAPMERANPR